MNNSGNFLELSAIRVKQPLADFFAVVFKARELLSVSFSEPAETADKYGNVDWTQREEDRKRTIEIGKYIDTVDSAFPNTIILGANFNQNGDHVVDNDLRWRIEETDKDTFKLVIPTNNKLASIIDGQHRLHGFKFIDNDDRLEMQLLCSVYIDMPMPYHAYLFSTINFNQKKVDKSLAYSLFGFDLEKTPPEIWPPETLAIFIARKLNAEEGPFFQRISLGVKDTFSEPDDSWTISMATIVDGILGLITTNAKNDRYKLMGMTIPEGRHRTILDSNGPPLRFLYINGYDKALYEIVYNYFSAAHDVLWKDAGPKSYIKKTIGIQALFDVLKILMVDFQNTKQASFEYFYDLLNNVKGIDFTKMEASGIGKTKVKNAILIKLKYININSIEDKSDKEFYLSILG